MSKKLNAVTVRELRELLAHYDDEMLVVFEYPSHDYWHTTLAGGVRSVDECGVKWSDYHGEWKMADDDEFGEEGVETVLVLG